MRERFSNVRRSSAGTKGRPARGRFRNVRQAAFNLDVRGDGGPGGGGPSGQGPRGGIPGSRGRRRPSRRSSATSVVARGGAVSVEESVGADGPRRKVRRRYFDAGAGPAAAAAAGFGPPATRQVTRAAGWEEPLDEFPAPALGSGLGAAPWDAEGALRAPEGVAHRGLSGAPPVNFPTAAQLHGASIFNVSTSPPAEREGGFKNSVEEFPRLHKFANLDAEFLQLERTLMGHLLRSVERRSEGKSGTVASWAHVERMSSVQGFRFVPGPGRKKRRLSHDPALSLEQYMAENDIWPAIDAQHVMAPRNSRNLCRFCGGSHAPRTCSRNRCNVCMGVDHKNRGCPLSSLHCKTCSRFGHDASVCPAALRRQAELVSEESPGGSVAAAAPATVAAATVCLVCGGVGHYTCGKIGRPREAAAPVSPRMAGGCGVGADDEVQLLERPRTPPPPPPPPPAQAAPRAASRFRQWAQNPCVRVPMYAQC